MLAAATQTKLPRYIDARALLAELKARRTFRPVIARKPQVAAPKPAAPIALHRYERRSVAILSSAQAAVVAPGSVLPDMGKGVTYYTRARVVELVARGEMRWVDKHRNGATWTEKAAGTWQKTRCGEVCVMQLKIGFKGRHVPATQMDTLTVGGPEMEQFVPDVVFLLAAAVVIIWLIRRPAERCDGKDEEQ